MRKILCTLVLAAFATSMIGCRAEVDTTPTASDHPNGTYEKKTTTVERPNGSSEVHVESHSD
ncbi:MAG: hypothetical protein JO353_07675 [Phycisphaerae bacterium]|nr:hypothetical protein [Phycisphaerae bacterium]